MAIEIAVDLDGTILRDAFPKLGAPIEENVAQLHAWKRKGYRITIFTARVYKEGEEDKIRKFLTQNNIPFDKITNVKPHTATVFIDDRAIPVAYNQPWPSDISAKVEEIISMHREAIVDLKRIRVVDAKLRKY